MVVCTHLDQISQDNVEEHQKVVRKAFWPDDVMNTNSVIPCSSLMGLSARKLLDKSCDSKPSFEEIWRTDTVGYYVRGFPSKKLALSSHQCAAKLLGVRNPKTAYDQLGFQTWKNRLDLELHASGLPDAIQELTGEMVDRARIMALLSETDIITTYLKELRSIHGCVQLL